MSGIALIHGAGTLGTTSDWFRKREKIGSGLRSGFVAAEKASRDDALHRPEGVCPVPIQFVEYGPQLFGGDGSPPVADIPGRDAVRRWPAMDKYRCLCCPRGRRYRTNVREVTGTVARNSSSAWRFIEGKLPEVARYLTDPVIRNSVLGTVREQLEAARPRVIVAHSLGSLVAIEALASLPSNLQPELIVTLGSPIRLGMVYEKLNALSTGWPDVRTCAWINLHDRADVATGGKGLHADRFPGAINIAVSNGSHAHDADYYLRHAVIGQVIWEVATEEAGAADFAFGLRARDLPYVRVKERAQGSHELEPELEPELE